MSAALVMSGSSHIPRKPLPGVPLPAAVPPSNTEQQQSIGHRHTRTSSSSVFPAYAPPHPQPTYASTMNQYAPQSQPARRTLSNATTSTSSTSGAPSRNNSGALRRSSSSRSGSSGSPTSYVALMRKQKATVWCDRAQHEDPRILAAQRAARHRAQLEVVGGSSHLTPSAAAARSRNSNASSGSMASNVRSKIRHHGAPKASTYLPNANLAGSGVPMRLSATEVDEGDSDDDSYNAQTRYHQRTGSGRSSLGSGPRVGAPQSSSMTGATPRFSNNSTPPSADEDAPEDGVADLADETPVPGHYVRQEHGAGGYFDGKTGTGLSGSSGSSGSSGEGRENSFGALGSMPQRESVASSEGKSADELRRRGSVDERNMTMSGVRLFVANPDLSD